MNTIEQKESVLKKLRRYSTRTETSSQRYKCYNESKFKMNLVGNCDELSNYAFHYLIKLHSLKIFNYYKNEDPNPNKIIYFILYEALQPYDHVVISID
ncbi:hypothetical protein A9255_03330 [Xenorhabdus hominickii]|uniref:Uncharacterized protein n=1 Tax=Xenorhabdus hominickii TaxID=351679 RepID=A0A2G0Q2L0_XENHO|nr:hypothetical protein A9255_03330 [Xenorhabdus hominickii]PHM53464.1 hypothetical protein Xhom_03462 [Xenorhabdus hominickii]